MIDFDIKEIRSFSDSTITVITKDPDLEFLKLIYPFNFNLQVFDSIPGDMNAWEASPDSIVLDSMIHAEWEKELSGIQKISAYKDIPVIVLTEEEMDVSEIIANWNTNYLYIHRQNPESILRAVIATVKYWNKLNNALVKTNQLNRILSTNYLVLDTKIECLETIDKKLKVLSTIASNEIRKELLKLCDLIAENAKRGDHYQFFRAHFEEIHPLFYRKLLAINKDLSNNDLKLAAFIKMNFNNPEISFFMGISLAGVKKAIQRLKVKLKILPQESLRQFILTIEV